MATSDYIYNFSDTLPAAPAGRANVKFQSTGSNPRTISAHAPNVGGVSAKTTSYFALDSDSGTLLTFNSAGAATLMLPSPSPGNRWWISYSNLGAGLLTINPNGLQLDGAGANKTAIQFQGGIIFSDGTNYFILNGTGAGAAVLESSLSLSDITTNNVSSTKHGFAPKSPADATQFLNGAATPAYAQVKDSDLATTAVTSNDVTSTKHGFAPASPADATKFLNGGATPAYAQVKDSDLSLSAITTNNVSISKHGFAPVLPNDATKYLDGTGAYSVPAGGGGGGGGNFVRLAQTVVGVATSSVTLAGISGSYTSLQLNFCGRGTFATGFCGVRVQFNGDTAANYEYNIFYVSGGSVGSGQSTGQTSIFVGNMPGSTIAANYPGVFHMLIPAYSQTAFHKGLTSHSYYMTSSTQQCILHAGGWNSTSAISSMTFTIDVGGNFDVGTTFTLYGLT